MSAHNSSSSSSAPLSRPVFVVPSSGSSSSSGSASLAPTLPLQELLLPSQQYVDAVIAAGKAFIVDNPGHPLAHYADLPIRTDGRTWAWTLRGKDQAKEEMTKLWLLKQMGARGAKFRGGMKQHEIVIVENYKLICAILEERPEVRH